MVGQRTDEVRDIHIRDEVNLIRGRFGLVKEDWANIE